MTGMWVNSNSELNIWDLLVTNIVRIPELDSDIESEWSSRIKNESSHLAFAFFIYRRLRFVFHVDFYQVEIY